MDTNLIDNEKKIDDLLAEETETPPEEPSKVDKKVIKIKISRKNALITTVVILVLVAAYFLKGFLIAATVNGKPIGRLTVIQKLEKASGKNLLDSLINISLVNDEAVAKKVVIEQKDIDTEIKNIETQLTAQGVTLDKALADQGVSREDFEQQIVFQKQVEALVASKTAVSDEEVTQYITTNKIEINADQEATIKSQIKSQLVNQKLNQAATELLDNLKTKAKIRYFVNY